MIQKITLLFLACLGISSLSMAQPVCGFDAIHQQRMAQDTAYANFVNQFNTATLAYANAQQNLPQGLVTTYNGNKVWEIPVVVHVIHTGQTIGDPFQPYNPSATTISNFIDYLSQAFTASYTGHRLEANGGTRMPIVFKLAQRDPTGAATTGIVRVDASTDATYAANGVGTPGVSDAVLKAKSYWPNTEYYNIWVVYKIDGVNQANASSSYTAGYATFPTAGPYNQDGTVVLADKVSVGNSVITHELGHAFGLYHTFNGGNTSTCSPAPDDYVLDTPPMKQSNFNCPAENTNTCNPPSNLFLEAQKNFMDYSNCKEWFTTGQRVRVYAALQYLTAGPAALNIPSVRSSLISSLGATPPGASAKAGCLVPNGAALNSFGLRAVTVTKNGASPAPDTIIMNAMSGSSNGDGNHYYDRTKEHRVELEAGKTYNFRVTVGNNPEIVYAWIDYDNDGIFADPAERIYIQGAGPNTRPFSSFTVPAVGAVNCAPIRMRVITSSNGPCPTTPYFGQCEDYEVVIKGSGATTNIPGLATIITPIAAGNPSCLGSTVTVASTHLTSITPIWYQWFKKNGATITSYTGGVDSFITRNDWQDLDTVWARVAYPGLCGLDTTRTDSIVLYRPVTVTPTVNISVTKGTNPGCPDDTVRFTVTSNVNPGANPTYEWFVNGLSQGAATATPFWQAFNIPSGTTFRVKMNSSAGAPCSNPGFAFSNTITYTHTTKSPTLSLALISGTNPGCPNQALTFLATGTTTGLTPTYQWKVNSVPVQTGLSNTYTAVFNNNDVISCTMTSSTSCAVPNTANSANNITITHAPLIADVTIQQIKGNNPACTGHEMVFVATPTNSGANPQFQWLVNNAAVAGANSPIFSTYTLLNGDFVSCVLISTDPCVANTFDTSAILPMTITTSKNPTVTVAITKGNNPGCLDSLVEFTATDNNLGTAPNFDWLVNGFQIYNGQVFSNNNLQNGDVVVCRANQTDGGCYLPDTVSSAPITMTLSPTPEPPIISLVNNMLVTNKAGSFIWFGPAGQLTGGENGSFHPTELGQYYCVTNNNGCWSKPSNKLTITLLDISTYNINEVSIYPNPTTGLVSLDWGGKRVTMQVDIISTVGQKLMHADVVHQSHTSLDLGKLANGIYFIVVTDEQGKSGTARITVTK
jgi:hypothetical protein